MLALSLSLIISSSAMAAISPSLKECTQPCVDGLKNSKQACEKIHQEKKAEFEAKLNLSQAQKVKIDAIKSSEKKKIEAIRKETKAKMDAVLTADQRAKMKAMEPPKGPKPCQKPDCKCKKMMEERKAEMDKKLGLSQDQIKKLDAIRESERSQMEALRKETKLKMDAILTDAQKAQMEKMKPKHHKHNGNCPCEKKLNK